MVELLLLDPELELLLLLDDAESESVVGLVVLELVVSVSVLGVVVALLVLDEVVAGSVVLVVASLVSPVPPVVVEESGNTKPVVGASVSMKNGFSSMHAGRTRRANAMLTRFIKTSPSRPRSWGR